MAVRRPFLFLAPPGLFFVRLDTGLCGQRAGPRPPLPELFPLQGGGRFFSGHGGLFKVFRAALEEELVLIAGDVNGHAGPSPLGVGHLAEDPAVGGEDALDGLDRKSVV